MEWEIQGPRMIGIDLNWFVCRGWAGEGFVLENQTTRGAVGECSKKVNVRVLLFILPSQYLEMHDAYLPNL